MVPMIPLISKERETDREGKEEKSGHTIIELSDQVEKINYITRGSDDFTLIW